MKNFRTVLAGIALIVALPAAAATTVDFDVLPGGSTLPNSGTAISTQYASLGVTFSGTNTSTGATGPLNAWGLIVATGLGGSGNYLGNFGAVPCCGVNNYLIAPRYDVSSFLFDGTASDVSFGLYTGGGQNSVTINAYGAHGALLQSLVNVTANEGKFVIQTLTAVGIAKIDVVGGFFSPGGSAKLYGIDNLTFTSDVAAVPEATTWAMMIAGFGMTGAFMRRRKPSMAVAVA